MKKFRVEVPLIVSRRNIYIIEAEDAEEAIEIAMRDDNPADTMTDDTEEDWTCPEVKEIG